MKRIVSIQDISCFGKCSLTVALPIISAMGIEACPVPTAVLSTHTGGFTGYTYRDLTNDIPSIADHWKSLDLKFDAVATGYLGSFEQIKIVSDFFDKFKTDDNLIIVDPVMGDKGHFYAGFTEDFALEMKKLCSKADLGAVARCCCYKIKIIFSFKSFLYNLHMKKSQKSASETKTKCNRCFRFKHKCRIIKL